MAYNIKVSHNSPAIQQFIEWRVYEAKPKLNVDIVFYNEKDNIEVATFKIIIKIDFYCSGSFKSEYSDITLDSYKINDDNTKEQVGKLFENKKIIDNFKKSFVESVSDSLIPTYSFNEILENILNEF